MSDLVLCLDGRSAAAPRARLTCGQETADGGRVDLRLARTDLDDLRWLWADRTSDRYNDTSGRRRRAEMAVVRIGAVLGRAFASTRAAAGLLDRALERSSFSFRVHSANPRILELPWELATTPAGRFLVGRATTFTRSFGVGAATVRRKRRPGQLRVLVSVSRPSGAGDVSYMAVAGTLLETVDGCATVHVVRPGTLAALADTLRQDDWDYVHIDGHGVPGGLRFEDGFVSADVLVGALGRQEGRAFTLNACDSAVGGGRQRKRGRSVAQALLETGARGVVAMGAAVRVSSAAAFFAEFYAAAAEGATLARSCAAGRMALRTDPLAGKADWGIPVVYAEGPDRSLRLRAAGDRSVEAGTATGTGEPFVGRDGELWTLDRMLDAPGPVLVHGAMGIGKTMLAGHLLDWRRRTGSVERVIHFSFESRPSLEALCQALEAEALATALTPPPAPTGPETVALTVAERLDRVAQALATDTIRRHVLLDRVDVMEPHESAGALRRVIGTLGGPSCRVVLTARGACPGWLGGVVRRLRIAGVRPRDRLRLLRAHARRMGSWDRIERQLEAAVETNEVEALSELLGGHPLTTRAAAHRLRSHTLRQIIDALGSGKALPLSPAAEGPNPPRSLNDLVGSALGGLEPDRRHAVALLGLFPGRFTEAELTGFVLEAGLPPMPSGHAAGGAAIVRFAEAAGLIFPATPDEGWLVVPGAAPALRKELDSATVARIELAFARFWDDRARFHSTRFHGNAPAETTAFVRHARWNLRRALEFANAHGEWRAAYGILSLLLEVNPILGRRAENEKLIARWLARTEAARRRAPEDVPLTDLWRLLAGQRARQLSNEGRFRQAMALYGRIDETLRGDEELHAENLAVNALLMGEIEEQRGALEAAEARYIDALGRAEKLGDEEGQAQACAALGDLDVARARLPEARRWYVRALELDRRAANTYGVALMHLHLGRIELRQNELGAAEAWYRDGLDLLSAMPPNALVASLQSDLGMVAIERGQLDEAEARFREVLAIHGTLGNEANVAVICHQLGEMEYHRGRDSPCAGEEEERFAAAEAWYRTSAEIEEALGDRVGAAASYHQLGVLEQLRENPAAAEAWYRKALQWSRGSTNPEHLGTIHAQLGRCLVERGDTEAAAEHLITGYVYLLRARAPGAARLKANLVALRDALGEKRFVREWRRARAPAEAMTRFVAKGRHGHVHAAGGDTSDTSA